VRVLSRDIHARTGAHLYVRIEPQTTPCMDWREVLLPPEAAAWSDDQLTAVLLHEWGHRLIAPVSPAIGKLWSQLARRIVGGEQRGQLVANLVADAWVDRTNLRDRYWGARYRRGEQEAVSEAARRLKRRAPPDPSGKDAVTFPALWIAFSERLVADACCEAGEPVPPTATLDGLPASGRQRVDALWNVCFAGHRTMEQRVEELARLLKDILPEEPEPILILISRVYPYLRGMKGGRTDPTAAELRRARVAGLQEDELAELFGEDTLRRMDQEVQRLKMYARIVPVVNRFLRRAGQRAFSGYKPWPIGRSLRELDLIASLQRTPVLVPGSGLLSRRYDRLGLQSDRGSGAVILVVDDSGSTSGATLEREQEAAMAVIAAARAFADPVGCVVFGSSVTASVAPTSRYPVVEETICSLGSNSGGTTLGPALLEAIRLIGDLPACALMIMTDAELYDVDEVHEILTALPGGIQVTLFCFNDAERVRDGLRWPHRRSVRVLRASAETPFAESALEEVYG
jgi:hypothetical protein